MTSAAQVLANRSNAQKSTGPRTAQGKAVVSQNAVKHGLLAKEVVIRGEDPGAFEFYRDQMLEELAPVGQVESMLAARVVSLSWRLQRAERIQGAAFEAMYQQDTAGPLAGVNRRLRAKPDPGEGDLVVGQIVVEDFSHARVLDRLLMYERRIEHSLYRTMGELQKQRLMRELDPPVGGATAEGGLASSEPVRDERPPWSEEIGRGCPTYEGPPEGGTPNGADAEGQSCETNPICAGPNEGRVPCGTGTMNDLAQGESGETNPMCDRIRLRKEDVRECLVSSHT
jgi:hypothetical protein